MDNQKPAEQPTKPTAADSRRKDVGPRLIRSQTRTAMSFVFNVAVKKPLILVRGSKFFVGQQECRVWIDAEGRAFAVEYGEDPNE